MRKFAITAVAVGALAAGGLGLPAVALAIPLSGEPADVAVRALESEGYTVRINQTVSVPLSQCSVLSVNGLRGTEGNGVVLDPTRLNVATLDVNCPSHS